MANNKTIDQFSNTGITKFAVNKVILDEINDRVISLIQRKKLLTSKNKISLENFHNSVAVKNLNEIRMYLYAQLNKQDWILDKMFELFNSQIKLILGDELAVQKKLIYQFNFQTIIAQYFQCTLIFLVENPYIN